MKKPLATPEFIVSLHICINVLAPHVVIFMYKLSALNKLDK